MHRFLTLASFICATTARKPRILDGEATSIERVPYQVSLSRDHHSHTCGASIISKDWILTAGHCAGHMPLKYRVRVGSSFSDRGGEIHRVAEIVRHEGFRREDQPHNDIALMRVTPPIAFDHRTKSPIKIYDRLDVLKSGDVGLVAGWGAVKKPNLEVSEQLMSVNLTVIPKAECLDDFNMVEDNMPINNFCAKHPSGRKNSCQGDSGGAFVVNGKQAGIVSWGSPWDCDDVGIPSVYVEVAKYHDWIYKHARLSSKL